MSDKPWKRKPEEQNPKSWRDVMDHKMNHKDVKKACRVAESAGYRFFFFQDRIVEVVDGEPWDTRYPIEGLLPTMEEVEAFIGEMLPEDLTKFVEKLVKYNERFAFLRR